MLNLLNAVKVSDALFWMLVVLGIILIVEIAVFAILMIYRKHKTPVEKARQAVGITLDTQIVRREFRVGENFDPSGLIVTVHYNDDPLEETLHEFTIITPELVKKLAREGKQPEDLLGCRIYAPDLSVEGKPSVTVAFMNQTAAYAISVVESETVATEPKPVESRVIVQTVAAPVVAPVVAPVAAPVAEMVEYAITVVAPEELDALQVALYNGAKRVGDAVNVENGKATIVAPAGEYLVRVFGLPDSDYEISGGLLSEDKRSVTVTIDYCEDYYASDNSEEEPEVEEVVPTVSEVLEIEPEIELVNYNIIVNAPEGLSALQVALYNGDTKIGDAVNVESGAAMITAEEGEYAVRVFGVPEGYEVSEGTVSGTRHICTITITAPVHEEELAIADAAPVEQPEVIVQTAEPIVIVEESLEGGILRYDRSFTARLIQSSNEVKDWYTELKNDLLSYKKVHDRMSWKRESYNFGRLPFARLAYRGETLCLYLPLDPESLADSKYKVESVADSTSYEDTPCLYRIKNNKRVKYAKELIATVAELLQTPRIERESQDYYVPYEGLVELINKGLIKRNIKNKQDEIFFEKKTQQETNN